MKLLLLVFSLCVLAHQVQSFSSQTCNHTQIINSFTNYGSCYQRKSTSIKANFCLGFETAERCAQDSFHPCFGDDATLMSSIVQMDLRRLIQTTLDKLKFSEDVVDSILLTCPKAPTDREMENYTQKMFYWFDFLQTDGDCSRGEVEEIQTGLQECLVSQGGTFKVELHSRVNRARGNLRRTICQTLYDTLGECWRRDMPVCFSHREADYIKETMEGAFKGGYNVGKESFKLLKPNVNIPEIDVIECLEGEQ